MRLRWRWDAEQSMWRCAVLVGDQLVGWWFVLPGSTADILSDVAEMNVVPQVTEAVQ